MKLMDSIFLAAGVFLGVTQGQWDNVSDGNLGVECPAGQAFFRIESMYRSTSRDRLWKFHCKSMESLSHEQKCTWYENVNTYDNILDFRCTDGDAVTGVRSVHNNHHEDRVWSYKCCHAAWPYTCTPSNRQAAGYVNHLQGPFDYRNPNYIEGFYSVHSNDHEDRLWKVIKVDLSCRKTCGCPRFLDSTWTVSRMDYTYNHLEVVQGTPELLHMAVFDNTNSTGPGSQTFEYSVIKTDTSSYETSSEVGIMAGFKYEVGVPGVSSTSGYVEVSASVGQTWGGASATANEYKAISSATIMAGRKIRMTATVKKGSLDIPFAMTLEKMGCQCVVSGTWKGVSYFGTTTNVVDITGEKRSVEERSTNDEESDDIECGQGPNGWECTGQSVTFVEFDEFSIRSSAVNNANKMAGKTASECFKECQVDSNCVGVVRKSSVAPKDSDECYSVGQGQISSECKPDDVTDNAFVVWIEQGRIHDCEVPRAP